MPGEAGEGGRSEREGGRAPRSRERRAARLRREGMHRGRQGGRGEDRECWREMKMKP